VLLTSQAEIFEKSKSLEPHLRINNLAQFMRTIHADNWVFVSFNNGPGLGAMAEEAVTIDVPGEKLFYHDRGVNKFDFLLELAKMDTSNTVVFTDNTMMMNRVAPRLMTKPLLRVIYLYGQETGLNY